MITNGSSLLVKESCSNLPNLSSTVTKWFKPLSMDLITKSVVDFEVVETSAEIPFNGVIQNLDSRALRILPEAQRAWTWKMIHALPGLKLKNDDIIKYENIKYRVMNIRDFKEYGYVEYNVVEAYNDV